jgi:hypothetical protein
VAFDLVSLLLLMLAGWGLLRAVSAWRQRSRATHRALAGVGLVLRITGTALVMLAPAMTGGWAATWTWAPDLALVIACLASLLAATTALRLGLLLRRQTSSPDPSIERKHHVLAGA